MLWEWTSPCICLFISHLLWSPHRSWKMTPIWRQGWRQSKTGRNGQRGLGAHKGPLHTSLLSQSQPHTCAIFQLPFTLGDKKCFGSISTWHTLAINACFLLSFPNVCELCCIIIVSGIYNMLHSRLPFPCMWVNLYKNTTCFIKSTYKWWLLLLLYCK